MVHAQNTEYQIEDNIKYKKQTYQQCRMEKFIDQKKRKLEELGKQKYVGQEMPMVEDGMSYNVEEIQTGERRQVNFFDFENLNKLTK